ncbi:hypothetical protein Tco_0952429 [Tanacetum coccineum]|uniref:Uncharacterized protein n=1 Tax=Tanacetum coccineum TaxID=301880 RepID=A0ABQ5DXX1_9ASTR
MDKHGVPPTKRILILVTESHSLTRSPNSFVLGDETSGKANFHLIFNATGFLRRKMKSKDARVKNGVFTPEGEKKVHMMSKKDLDNNCEEKIMVVLR